MSNLTIVFVFVIILNILTISSEFDRLELVNLDTAKMEVR